VPSRCCPACDSPDTRFFATAWDSEYRTTSEKFSYFRCDGCQSIFLDPFPLDRLGEIYPPSYYSYTPRGTASLAERIKWKLDGRLFRGILRRIPGEWLSVLDVGGGAGWMLTLIREQDPRVTETHEVDIDESARESAEEAGHVFHCQRVEELAIEHRFDLIVMLNLIEHVARPAAVLRAMRALMSEDGAILIKTPNTDTLDRVLFQNRNWGGFHCPRHWVLFTKEGFIELAERCGLRCQWVRFTQGAPQWTASILGWLADRGVIDVTPARPMYMHPLFTPVLAFTAVIDLLRRPVMRTAQMFVLLRAA